MRKQGRSVYRAQSQKRDSVYQVGLQQAQAQEGSVIRRYKPSTECSEKNKRQKQ